MQHVELSDEILLLRPVGDGDSTAIYEAVCESLPELIPWMPWAHAGYARADHERWMTESKQVWESNTDRGFVMIERVSGDVVGTCGLNQFDLLHRRANLGYWVRSSASGRGIAARAARLVARFGFEQVGFQRIEIWVAVGNQRSERAAEKAGGLREGVARRRLRSATGKTTRRAFRSSPRIWG